MSQANNPICPCSPVCAPFPFAAPSLPLSTFSFHLSPPAVIARIGRTCIRFDNLPTWHDVLSVNHCNLFPAAVNRGDGNERKVWKAGRKHVLCRKEIVQDKIRGSTMNVCNEIFKPPIYFCLKEKLSILKADIEPHFQYIFGKPSEISY